jgi:hypothetical protein
MEEIDFCPEWLMIPDKFKLLLGFKWIEKKYARIYLYVPPDWKEDWTQMKRVSPEMTR